ncbi:D-2-hydroxyacid dehydrogenase [Terrisporobacter sp.]
MYNILVLIPMDEEKKKRIEEKAKDCQIVYYNEDNVSKEEVQKANIIIGKPPVDMVKNSTNLKWLHLNTAGVDLFIKEGVLNRGVILTNSTGAYGQAVSEHMLAMLLELLKKLHLYRDNQNKRLWQSEGSVRSIRNCKVLIVGLGDIGCNFGQMVKVLGGYTIGVKRRSSKKPDYIDELYLNDKLDELLPQVDVVALCLPSTKDTQKLFNAQRIALMKKGSILLNVGRGASVDTEALCDAIESKHLSGAGIDVVDPEPLPSNHRIWNLENVVITPHISGWYNLAETYERIVDISLNNLDRFLNGDKLSNIIDFNTGYVK